MGPKHQDQSNEETTLNLTPDINHIEVSFLTFDPFEAWEPLKSLDNPKTNQSIAQSINRSINQCDGTPAVPALPSLQVNLCFLSLRGFLEVLEDLVVLAHQLDQGPLSA